MSKLNWEGSRVLVTGGAGFIGSHLVNKLVKLGSEVFVADNLSRGRKENLGTVLDRIQFYQLDLTELDNCLIAVEGIDYIFHLAASVGGIHYIEKENVAGLTPSLLMNTNMLEAARIKDVKRLLFTSSACVYPERNSLLNKFKEQDGYPANPHTTYGWAKILGEVACKAYCLDYGMKTSVVRIFNAYGENENLELRWSHVIPSLIRKAILYPKDGFEMFGDGKQERAFLYVQDCVDGLLLSMEKIVDADPVNLGSEEVISIDVVAKKIIRISGKDIKIEYNLSGPKGTHRYCADTVRMKSVLNWTPNISLNEGLQRTYDWARELLASPNIKNIRLNT